MTAPSRDASVGLYLHIPFCSVKCAFCHFATFPGLRKQIPRYLDALRREMEGYRGRRVRTIYVGGGSPSLLSPDQFRSLFASVRGNFKVQRNCEVTVECHPAQASGALLEALKGEGVNRLSFGLQTGEEDLLRSLNRNEGTAALSRVLQEALSAGFRNLNVDVIYGLPGQTLAGWNETLDSVLDLPITHLSAYALETDERTALSHRGVQEDPDLGARMYQQLCRKARRAGFEHYEISNFARPGFRCRHNLLYWRNRRTVGLGISAASFDGASRRQNTATFFEYLERVESGRSAVAEEECLSAAARRWEEMLLGLRLEEGMRLPRRIFRTIEGRWKGWVAKGWARSGPRVRRIALSEEGWLVSNSIFRELMDALAV